MKKNAVTMAQLIRAKKAADKARTEAMDLQNQYDKQTVLPKVRALTGMYLVYPQNCYSCPEKPSDYWDTYARVTGSDGCLLLMTEVFVDSRGVGTIHTNKRLVTFDGTIPDGWQKTTKARYLREVRRVLRLAGIKP
jgi:hypothetical protein